MTPMRGPSPNATRRSPNGIFILGYVQDVGVALGKGSPFRLHLTADGGAEVRALYDSRADAVAAATQLGGLRAMVALAGGEEVRHAVN